MPKLYCLVRSELKIFPASYRDEEAFRQEFVGIALQFADLVPKALEASQFAALPYGRIDSITVTAKQGSIIEISDIRIDISHLTFPKLVILTLLAQGPAYIHEIREWIDRPKPETEEIIMHRDVFDEIEDAARQFHTCIEHEAWEHGFKETTPEEKAEFSYLERRMMYSLEIPLPTKIKRIPLAAEENAKRIDVRELPFDTAIRSQDPGYEVLISADSTEFEPNEVEESYFPELKLVTAFKRSGERGWRSSSHWEA